MKTSSIGFVMVVGLTLFPSWVCAQSLAGAAAKEKERRKQTAPASGTKVYSEGDLQGSGAPAADPAPSPSGSSGTRSSPSATGVINRTPSAATSGGSEVSWRQRATSARARISTAEARVKSEEREANGKAATGAPRPSDCNVPDYVVRQGTEAMKRWSCQQAAPTPDPRAGLVSAQRELQSAKDAWTALEDQARRAGIPAGWLR